MTDEAEGLLETDQNLSAIYSKIRSARCTVFLDIDETVLSCMDRWQEYVLSELNIQLSMKQIKQAGSVDDVFFKSPLYSEFTKWADKLRISEEFNSNLPAVAGSLKAIHELSAMSNLELGGYLTARPLEVIKVTSHNLLEIGFPSLTIIGRPSNTQYTSSVKWKIGILNNLRDNYDGTLIMLDDSVDLALEIQKNNNTSRYIVVILIKTPFNLVKIRRERINTKATNHLYVTTWLNVPTMCAKYTRG
jgi:hypothetical protein